MYLPDVLTIVKMSKTKDSVNREDSLTNVFHYVIQQNHDRICASVEGASEGNFGTFWLEISQNP